MCHRPRRLASRTRYVALAIQIAILLATFLLTRVAVLALLAHAEHARPAAGVARALAAGEAYDLLVALWLAAPLALYLSLSPDRWWARRGQRAALYLVLGGSIALAAVTAVAEVLFFDEFTGRFNFVAVDYLVYPTEVVTNLRESYPVGWLLGVAVAAAAALVWWLRPRLRAALVAPVRGRERVLVALGYAALLAALTAGIRPELARVSDDRALNEVAANGDYTFWQALLGQDAPYAGLYATQPDSALFPRLQRALGERASRGASFTPGSTLRAVQGLRPERRLNVVIVLEESLGSGFVGALHPEGPRLTPEFDALARRGTLLTNAYSTGNRTIRALEATTTSLPPLPGVSVVRRAASHDLFTLPALLRARGYSTEFVYGGRAFFDNMGAYMRANGVERVIDQADYPPGLFTTAWGVADEAIFDMTLRQLDSLDATGRPFYMQVLTVSNHRPYTYPAGRIAADPAAHRRDHAVQYADWALGRFLREARRHHYYDHTLFVVMGDHGPRVYGAEEIPLASYEVPILFLAPDDVLPTGTRVGARVGTLASSMDVPPTILGLLGMSYASKFFGRDVFQEDSADGRAFMTHNSELAEMRGRDLAVLGLRGAERLYRYDAAEGRLTSTHDAGERALLDEAVAYYNGADRLYRDGGYLFGPPAPTIAKADHPRTRPAHL